MFCTQQASHPPHTPHTLWPVVGTGKCVHHRPLKHMWPPINLPGLIPWSPNRCFSCLISSCPQGIISRAQLPRCLSMLKYNLLLLVDFLYFCSLCSWSLKLTSCRPLDRGGNLCGKQKKGLFTYLPYWKLHDNNKMARRSLIPMLLLVICCLASAGKFFFFSLLIFI